MTESTLNANPEVIVTGEAISIAGRSFDLPGISSVECARVEAPSDGPVLMSVSGAICLLAAFGDAGWVGLALGSGLLGGAAVWRSQKKPSFELRIRTSTGDEVPWESADAEPVERAAASIRRALAGTGEPRG